MQARQHLMQGLKVERDWRVGGVDEIPIDWVELELRNPLGPRVNAFLQLSIHVIILAQRLIINSDQYVTFRFLRNFMRVILIY